MGNIHATETEKINVPANELPDILIWSCDKTGVKKRPFFKTTVKNRRLNVVDFSVFCEPYNPIYPRLVGNSKPNFI